MQSNTPPDSPIQPSQFEGQQPRRRFRAGVLRPPFTAASTAMFAKATAIAAGARGTVSGDPSAAGGVRGTVSGDPSSAGGGAGGGAQPGFFRRIFLGFKKAASLIRCREQYLNRGGQANEEAEINLEDGKDDKFYIWKNKVWRKKTHKEVPAMNHSVTDVQDYV